MDKGVTCEHLNKLVDVLGHELWQSKENLSCMDCGCHGPNLWLCLQPDCHHVGCSEGKNDHSTIHQKSYPSHCVHMNISTERIWCYLCEKEVHIKAAAHDRQNPDTTSLGGSSISTRYGSPALSNSPDDDLDPDEMDYDDETRPRGLVGLQNMGNTCYMNAALQALSNTAPLTSYFLDCAAAVAILAADKKPGLSRPSYSHERKPDSRCWGAWAWVQGRMSNCERGAYQKLIKDMWSRKTRGYVAPNGILYGMRNVHPMFRGYHQHDTQEFLRCFMDQLHEELKEPVWDGTSDDKITSEADGDHQDTRSIHVRRRAASSGASDAPFFTRMRRRSPAQSSYSESRTDGYFRSQGAEGSCSAAAGGAGGVAGRHRRSASFAGTQHVGHVQVHAHHRPNTALPGVSGGSGGPIPSAASAGSESELSGSSEAEDRYETCSSGASDAPESPHTGGVGAGVLKCTGGEGGEGDGRGVRYRSVVSDVFDGKLLSSVQCLICDRVSTRVETFQDLSLPIPSREHVAVLRSQQPILNHHTAHATQESWVSTQFVHRLSQVWWLLSWLRSWFYGPAVSLQDCLAAFFSADELKGDNMYSCSRCNKLRNGIKMSGVMRLPEVLCVHLKRFRHELMFSAKVAARVSFPINDLNMAPYTHKDCTSKVTRYELCAVISHAGTAGGGHYTCVARNSGGWYSFDDQCVTPLSHHQLHHIEAYVLFYRKVNPQMTVLRQKAAEILESTTIEPNDIKFYISKQWINKFNTWAEPGAIDNSDFVCVHGGVRPDRAQHLQHLAALVPQPLWEFLYHHFGGGPACSHVHECGACARSARRLRARTDYELTRFIQLHAIFQEQERPLAIYAISMHWFRQWQAFVRGRTVQPPPPLDNTGIVTKQEVDGVTTYVLKQGSDHAQLSEELWRFFIDIYGGGPEVKLRSPTHTQQAIPQTQNTQREQVIDTKRLHRKYSESDREDYCTKSTSETNIRDTVHGELQKNQSLQNINRHYNKVSKSTDSEDDAAYPVLKYKRQEQNGNYTDEDMDISPPRYTNTIRMENGVDSSDHDANDNPIYKKTDRSEELPSLDSISLKNKPSKTRKVRRMRSRTVK